jgi:hypothetical protein
MMRTLYGLMGVATLAFLGIRQMRTAYTKAESNGAYAMMIIALLITVANTF